METKELKITIPEGYCIDESKSTFEKIVFKKKDNRPRSWEEYCKNFTGQVFFIANNSTINSDYNADRGLQVGMDKNTLPTKELAEAFIVMMQLMSLRQDWIHKWSIDNGMTDDWKPDWKDRSSYKYCITGVYNNDFEVHCNTYVRRTLSFPTGEMAEDFMNTFRDLLEIAKPLI